jgi:HPt (histidine-containing phosphotransfer) domain-containing protein
MAVPEHPGAGVALDAERFRQATFDDRKLQQEVLAIFRGQSAELIAELEGIGPGGDVSRLAHLLRGSALGIGAAALAETADRLQGSWMPPQARAEIIVTLRQQVAEVTATIERMIGS